jgi:glucose/arabinose dehydrogenase
MLNGLEYVSIPHQRGCGDRVHICIRRAVLLEIIVSANADAAERCVPARRIFTKPDSYIRRRRIVIGSRITKQSRSAQDSGELWCSVNERDGLGDNLVPDYVTHVTAGGFYGWPGGTWAVTRIPEGRQFPVEYQGDIFASEHGSWNKSVRAGYEVIRVPLHQTGRASGEYEDFVTGFVVNNQEA